MPALWIEPGSRPAAKAPLPPVGPFRRRSAARLPGRVAQEIGSGGFVRVPKKLAIFGFHLCASIFIGLCAYGLLIYTGGGTQPPGGILSSLLFGVVTVGCIAGIGYFGSQWDKRNAEESGGAKRSPSVP